MNLVERSAQQSAGEFAAVRGEAPASLDAFARAVLGTIAEPGDGVLGRVIAAVGAAAAAEALLAGAPAERLADAVGAAGGDLDEREAESGLARWRPRLDHGDFVRSLAQAGRVGARLIVPGDACWPSGVDELGVHAPIGLWVRGRSDALDGRVPTIALVGARAATGYGEHVAMESSAGLVDRGFAIVSGGAYGIDGMAHRAALASDGMTIAFLAGGVDRFYPLGHESLLSLIAQTGAVVSELPCGAAPTKWRFLQRNRLIAAASGATVVLEAGIRSGSLNTAGHAAALGRPLGAVPGPVTSPASAGCHRLLREFDAVCVVDADQMAELAGRATRPGATTRDPAAAGAVGSRPRALAADTPGARSAVDDPDAIRILDAMSSRRPRELPEVARRAGLTVIEAMAALGRLEAEGVVERRPGGWLRRRAG
ncbi:DNA protecting protein DprA [Agromyces ramosus]|uniref:DNA protecting protein DprA n=1 Tax=Agromyces ramosus TaxID=33879 RepID=A0A4Q7MH33_9MICO|nr:DNA-processing protein DprA [Agromyces ramosus]RZS66042.1 DNA protecting protein DprA [Agromyces ramosus]